MAELNRRFIRINMFELITSLTNAADLVRPELANHHKQVAYLSYRIAEQLNHSNDDFRNLLLAGLMHDVGALSFDSQLELIENETPSFNDHAFRGARLLENYEPLRQVAGIIRYHHLPWGHGSGMTFQGKPVSIFSHILHLADRVAVSIDPKTEILSQVKKIFETVKKGEGSIYHPELILALEALSKKEYVWLDLVSNNLLELISNFVSFDTVHMNLDETMNLTKIFASIIDYRSPFTANHTAGVANTAKKLAELVGFCENECKMMQIAGHLHDLGKLAVSKEVLEKPSNLDVDEFNSIRSHAFYTYRLLQPIKGFEVINQWASFHHEKLDGSGYPFHLTAEEIPLGSRIMAVADIFTAITEDRPYRRGMTRQQAIEVLNKMVTDKAICPKIVALLVENYDLLNETRKKAQLLASMEYNYFATHDID